MGLTRGSTDLPAGFRGFSSRGVAFADFGEDLGAGLFGLDGVGATEGVGSGAKGTTFSDAFEEWVTLDGFFAGAAFFREDADSALEAGGVVSWARRA